MSLYAQPTFLGAKNKVSLLTTSVLSSTVTDNLVQVSGIDSDLPTAPFPILLGSDVSAELVQCSSVGVGNWLTLDRTTYGATQVEHAIGSTAKVVVIAEYITELQAQCVSQAAEMNNILELVLLTTNPAITDGVMDEIGGMLVVSQSATVGYVTVATGVAFLGGMLYAASSPQEVSVVSYLSQASTVVGGRINVLVYLDSNRTLQTVAGAVVSSPSEPPSPPIPTGSFVALAIVTASSTAVTDVDVSVRNLIL